MTGHKNPPPMKPSRKPSLKPHLKHFRKQLPGMTKTPVTEPDPGEAANTEAGDGPSKSQADDIEARIAEAENRGYMRGRNERIAELMRQPALFERQTSPSARDAPGGIAADSQGDSLPMILNNPRVSIWDR